MTFITALTSILIFFDLTFNVDSNSVLLNSIRMNPTDMGFIFDVNYACDYPENTHPLYTDARLDNVSCEKAREMADPECPFDHSTCPKNCNRYGSCDWQDRIFYHLGGESGSVGEVIAHEFHPDEDIYFLKSYLESTSHCHILMSPTFRSTGSCTENGYNVMVFFDSVSSRFIDPENTTCLSYNNNAYYLALHQDHPGMTGYDSKIVVGFNETFVYVFHNRSICP